MALLRCFDCTLQATIKHAAARQNAISLVAVTTSTNGIESATYDIPTSTTSCSTSTKLRRNRRSQAKRQRLFDSSDGSRTRTVYAANQPVIPSMRIGSGNCSGESGSRRHTCSTKNPITGGSIVTVSNSVRRLNFMRTLSPLRIEMYRFHDLTQVV